MKLSDEEVARIGRYTDIFSRLAAEFQDEMSRIGDHGKKYRYITKEQAMNRLDDCVGPANWDYKYYREDDIVNCIIRVILPDGSQLERAGCSPIDDDERVKKQTRVKGAYSDAFKVAAAGYGVGRYIKGGMPHYARRSRPGPPDEDTAPAAPARPVAPREFPPAARGPSEPPAASEFLHRKGESRFGHRPGPGLFKKYANPPYGGSYLDVLNSYGKERGFPERIVNWDAAQCAEADEAIQMGETG